MISRSMHPLIAQFLSYNTMVLKLFLAFECISNLFFFFFLIIPLFDCHLMCFSQGFSTLALFQPSQIILCWSCVLEHVRQHTHSLITGGLQHAPPGCDRQKCLQTWANVSLESNSTPDWAGLVHPGHLLVDVKDMPSLGRRLLGTWSPFTAPVTVPSPQQNTPGEETPL